MCRRQVPTTGTTITRSFTRAGDETSQPSRQLELADVSCLITVSGTILTVQIISPQCARSLSVRLCYYDFDIVKSINLSVTGMLLMSPIYSMDFRDQSYMHQPFETTLKCLGCLRPFLSAV